MDDSFRVRAAMNCQGIWGLTGIMLLPDEKPCQKTPSVERHGGQGEVPVPVHESISLGTLPYAAVKILNDHTTAPPRFQSSLSCLGASVL